MTDFFNRNGAMPASNMTSTKMLPPLIVAFINPLPLIGAVSVAIGSRIIAVDGIGENTVVPLGLAIAVMAWVGTKLYQYGRSVAEDSSEKQDINRRLNAQLKLIREVCAKLPKNVIDESSMEIRELLEEADACPPATKSKKR